MTVEGWCKCNRLFFSILKEIIASQFLIQFNFEVVTAFVYNSTASKSQATEKMGRICGARYTPKANGCLHFTVGKWEAL
jgi:hypothetical protein